MNLSPLVIATIVVAILVVLVAFWAIRTFNVLIASATRSARPGADRRAAQAPPRPGAEPGRNRQGVAGHERATLKAVVAARGRRGGRRRRPLDRPALGRRGRAHPDAGPALRARRAYPDLKANQNFLALQSELANTEDKIAYARQFYNTAVQALDKTAHSFPSLVVAGATGIKPPGYFQASGAEQAPVQVRF